MDKAQLAHEAQRLKDNETLQWVLSSLRAETIEELVYTPATDADTIRDHQSRVKVIDDFLARIEAIIRNGQPRKQAGIV
jgi:hypothetical protein